MKIAIMAAMEEEVQILREKLEDPHIENQTGVDFYRGKLAGHDVVLLQSGIGKVAAAATASLLLNCYPVDVLINTGSAGALDPKLNVGDIVISNDVAYYDVDLTAFGYPMGQLPGCPVTFPVNKKYRQLALDTVHSCQLSAVTGLICSGDTFVSHNDQKKKILTHFPDAVAAEMEAAAVGHVCWLLGIPFIVVRAISDKASHQAEMNFEEFLPLAAKNSSFIVEKMLVQLRCS